MISSWPDVGSCMENCCMFFRMMMEGVLEGAPLLEAGIYRLMMSPNITFLLLVKVVESIGSNKALLPLISTIRHNFLSIIQTCEKTTLHQIDVDPQFYNLCHQWKCELHHCCQMCSNYPN